MQVISPTYPADVVVSNVVQQIGNGVFELRGTERPGALIALSVSAPSVIVTNNT